MRTRSSGPVVEPSTTPRRRHNKKRSQQQVDPTIVEKPVVTMADTRTMAELLRAPTEGNAKAIIVPPIPAEHFELKHSLLNLVTSKQYFGFEKEDPHAHIRWFNKITSTMKYKDDRFKDLLRACPHHGFTKLHQLDTFYNSLNPTDQDSLNFAAGVQHNLDASSIWKKLSLPELTPTQMILELADRSTTRPTGIAEDVFVRVENFHFPADFVVIDYVVNPSSSP
ncbi:reverse transcriptase domain-containing protein [Tanacetum coccineum]|uniref:Reverse transcriptase domain-containing protein n=1 Tax=Tanacetum coccineum TaxID=301880 RepID=A0ABQ4X8D9_9ASTR